MAKWKEPIRATDYKGRAKSCKGNNMLFTVALIFSMSDQATKQDFIDIIAPRMDLNGCVVMIEKRGPLQGDPYSEVIIASIACQKLETI
jgi:hypothetical protein